MSAHTEDQRAGFVGKRQHKMDMAKFAETRSETAFGCFVGRKSPFFT